MWYAIGYEEVLRPDGTPPGSHMGTWRIINGPNTNPRAASLALGKALVSARGAAQHLHAAYTTCCLVQEEDLPLYNLFPADPRPSQMLLDEVEK